ncbi:MAG: hypothetical protein ACM3UL_02340 [Ignavibacteria bacterium]
MKRKYVAISIIFIMIAFVGGMLYLYENRFQPIGTPRILYSYSVTSTDTGVASNVFNVSQERTQQLNLTLQLLDGSPSITVPIDDMNGLVYNSTIVYDNNWDTHNWNHSLVQTSVFNYSFSQKQLTLQPNATIPTIITIHWANDAPSGRYALNLNLGSLQFLTPLREGDQSYSRAIRLGFIVSPKNPT